MTRRAAFHLIASVLVVSATTVTAVEHGQTAAPPKPAAAALSIGGDVPRPLTLTMADLKAMPRTTVTVDDKGRASVYEGVLVAELLGRAGAPLGKDLMGKALTTYVRASAIDGYEVVFSLAELDPAMTSNDVIVADTVDGKPLAEGLGPLRLATPHDKRPARALHMLTRLDVVRLSR